MTRTKTPAEYTTFESALKTILSVPKDEMKRREDDYQRERGTQKKKRAKISPASRASRDKG